MDVPLVERYSDCNNDVYTLLMERGESRNEHIVDMRVSADSPSRLNYNESSSSLEAAEIQNRHTGGASTTVPVSESLMPSGSGSNARSSSAGRRGDARRRRNPLNSGLWISVELALTISQIVASIVVLSVSRHEHPRAPLFLWIVGYGTGCFATLPLLYWRYHNRNQLIEQDAGQSRSGTSQISVPAGPFSVSVSRSSDGDDRHVAPAAASPRSSQRAGALNGRLKALIDYFKMGLDCFFAVWFVVGNVWIFGGRSSASDAPNMYRLCIIFLTFSCIGYAMPFILCATICCCLPCIISILGFREDLSRTRGASDEAIHALPTYKFKMKKCRNESDVENPAPGEGGIIAAGTERERMISGEDAVCCICLAKYANNDELKELSCSHFFHKECVDKWLKINALCPLCKSEVGVMAAGSEASMDMDAS
ncbi:hypothetical protein MLD38_015218 [Melastoma candidum]|uniref:Uncharacterized protein n=1 Tax=Melastoma candidum TaxID=119954 RepID=A0ACB9RHA6_9MYRT|nr:hypothetical protein MLD38_015218 [Melastoma candidum]